MARFVCGTWLCGANKVQGKIAALIAPLVIFGSLSSQAGTVPPGSLGPPSIKVFGDSFSQAGKFADIYTFTVAGPADVFGSVVSLDASLRFDISLASPQLFSGNPNGSFAQIAANAGCGTIGCSWDVASAGDYFLKITGSVTNALNLLLILALAPFSLGSVGFAGTIASVGESCRTNAAPRSASSVRQRPWRLGTF